MVYKHGVHYKFLRICKNLDKICHSAIVRKLYVHYYFAFYYIYESRNRFFMSTNLRKQKKNTKIKSMGET